MTDFDGSPDPLLPLPDVLLPGGDAPGCPGCVEGELDGAPGVLGAPGMPAGEGKPVGEGSPEGEGKPPELPDVGELGLLEGLGNELIGAHAATVSANAPIASKRCTGLHCCLNCCLKCLAAGDTR